MRSLIKIAYLRWLLKVAEGFLIFIMKPYMNCSETPDYGAKWKNLFKPILVTWELWYVTYCQ